MSRSVSSSLSSLNLYGNQSYIVTDIGTTPVAVLTVDTPSAILISCNAANKTDGSLSLSLYVVRDTTTAYVAHNLRVSATVPANIVTSPINLESGDIVYAVATLDDSFDLILTTQE